jgi:hypothetical protein
VPLVDGSNTASSVDMHDAFAKAGRLHDHPRAGDAGFKFVASENRIGHVFFIERVVGDFVKTIEGNTNLDGSATGIGSSDSVDAGATGRRSSVASGASTTGSRPPE